VTSADAPLTGMLPIPHVSDGEPSGGCSFTARPSAPFILPREVRRLESSDLELASCCRVNRPLTSLGREKSAVRPLKTMRTPTTSSEVKAAVRVSPEPSPNGRAAAGLPHKEAL